MIHRIAAALMMVAAVPAFAVQRTFVASIGSDTNPCSLPAPCRSFQVALSAVSAGGEVVALDSAGYGAVTIDKAVSLIAAPGIHAAITAPMPTAGVTVSAAGYDVVVVRGITISGMVGINGISADQLYVDRCTVHGASVGVGVGAGVRLVYITDSILDHNEYGVLSDGGPASRLYIKGSRFLDSDWGIQIHQGTVLVDNVHFEQINGNAGLLAQTNFYSEVIIAEVHNSTFYGGIASIMARALYSASSIAMTVEHSTMSAGQDGVNVRAENGGTAVVTITQSSANQNTAAGIVSYGPGATVAVTGTTASRNDVGLSQSNGATLVSFGNNTLVANKTNPTSGTITSDGLH